MVKIPPILCLLLPLLRCFPDIHFQQIVIVSYLLVSWRPRGIAAATHHSLVAVVAVDHGDPQRGLAVERASDPHVRVRGVVVRGVMVHERRRRAAEAGALQLGERVAVGVPRGGELEAAAEALQNAAVLRRVRLPGPDQSAVGSRGHARLLGRGFARVLRGFFALLLACFLLLLALLLLVFVLGFLLLLFVFGFVFVLRLRLVFPLVFLFALRFLLVYLFLLFFLILFLFGFVLELFLQLQRAHCKYITII
jgi:hypothetical protein